MPLLFYTLLLSILVFSPKDNSTKTNLIQLLEEIKSEKFDLDTFENTLRENHCSRILFEEYAGLECRLSNALLKGFHATRINVTTETSALEGRSLSLILFGYGKKREVAQEKVKQDYEHLVAALKDKFLFIDQSFYKGGEAMERLETMFSNGHGTAIFLQRLIGGCFDDRRIIISIGKEST